MEVPGRDAARPTDNGPGQMPVRIQAKYLVKKMKQMLGDILYVLVQEAQQPYTHHDGKQPLAGFKDGNATQAKMFRDKIFAGMHRPEGQVLFYTFHSTRLTSCEAMKFHSR